MALPSVQTSRPRAITQAEPGDRPAGRTETLIVLRQSEDQATVLVQSGYPTPAAAGAGPVYPPQCFPGVRGAAEAALVRVDFGEGREGVDFHLSPLPGWRVSGRVEASGANVHGLLMRLIPLGSEGLGPGSEAATTMAGDDGRFSFLGVTAGGYTIEVTPGRGEFSIDSTLASFTAPGRHRLPGTSGVVLAHVSGASGFLRFSRMMGEAETLWTRTPVEVRDGNVDGVVVELERTSTIRGLLQLDPDARPPGHRTAVSLRPSIANPMLVMPGIDVTPAEDSATPWARPREFAIRGLTPGRYHLGALGGSTAVKSIAWNGRDLTHRPLEVLAGQDLSDVVVTVTTNAASIAGVVTDRQGRAVTDAAVLHFPTDSDEWTHLGFSPPRTGSVSPDAAGGYVIGGLPAGEYYLVAVPLADGFAWRDSAFLAAAAPRATRLGVTWGETMRQDLRLQEIHRP